MSSMSENEDRQFSARRGPKVDLNTADDSCVAFASTNRLDGQVHGDETGGACGIDRNGWSAKVEMVADAVGYHAWQVRERASCLILVLARNSEYVVGHS
jgi:hypothetical protein